MSKYVGSLVFVERLKKDGTGADYHSGEYLILRQSEHVLYGCKMSPDYGAQDQKAFALIGTEPWSVVAATPVPSEDLAVFAGQCEEFASRKNSPGRQWVESVYSNVAQVARCVRGIVKSRQPSPTPEAFTVSVPAGVTSLVINFEPAA